MQTLISSKCLNEKCSQYNITVNVENPLIFGSYRCTECYSILELNITIGNLCFSTLEGFIKFTDGLQNELKLLHRLKNAKIMNCEDNKRYNEVIDLLEGAVCPDCFNLIIPTEQIIEYRNA